MIWRDSSPKNCNILSLSSYSFFMQIITSLFDFFMQLGQCLLKSASIRIAQPVLTKQKISFCMKSVTPNEL